MMIARIEMIQGQQASPVLEEALGRHQSHARCGRTGAGLRRQGARAVALHSPAGTQPGDMDESFITAGRRAPDTREGRTSEPRPEAAARSNQAWRRKR